jgi:broad specificity phosphatase PhoE
MKRARAGAATAGAVACVLLFFAVPAFAQQKVIFLVRHAERADTPAGQPPAAGMMANDPPLSAAGEQRAATLASLLATADIRHIYTTEYRRTRETAAPLARKLALTPVMSASRDPEPLVEQVLRVRGNVLVVGHSNTLPDLMKRLGVKQPVSIADSEYGDLFIVVKPETGNPTLVRLRF